MLPWCRVAIVFDVNNIIAQVMSFLVNSNGCNAQNVRINIITLGTIAWLNVYPLSDLYVPIILMILSIPNRPYH